MKRILLLTLAISPVGLCAVLAVNPQLGLAFRNMTNAHESTDTKVADGSVAGVDLRIGERSYFNHGAFFARSSTLVKAEGANAGAGEDNLVDTSEKVKALHGYHLIDGDAFKLRFNFGPTYGVLLTVDNKDDFNSGPFNLDAGPGLDLTIFTT